MEARFNLEAIQNAMAHWLDQMAEKQARAEEEMTDLRSVLFELSRTVDRLSETVDRFLKLAL